MKKAVGKRKKPVLEELKRQAEKAENRLKISEKNRNARQSLKKDNQDVYDALVSKRVYKDSYQVEEALEMIRTGKCGVFNPSLLESFFAVEGRIRRLYRRG